MKRILAVATNAGPLLGKHKTGLWLSELTDFIEVMKAAGHEVDLASPEGGVAPLDEKSGTDAAYTASLQSTLSLKETDVQKYDAIYLAGGHGAMFDFRESASLQKVMRDFTTQQKIVSAVCHGVAGLIAVTVADGKPLIQGRRVTGFSNLEDRLAGAAVHLPYLLETELKKNGAVYEKALLPFLPHVVTDGLLLTGQNPASVRPLAKKLLKILSKN